MSAGALLVLVLVLVVAVLAWPRRAGLTPDARYDLLVRRREPPPVEPLTREQVERMVKLARERDAQARGRRP